jgi:glycine cleavage system H protein
MNIKEDFFYTKDHEWIKLDENKFKIGITEYAQNSLGDITFIELPVVGTEYSESEVFANIESVKAVSEIFIPLAGKVIEVNGTLESNPELINSDPYGDGWICVLEKDPEVITDNLLTAAQYKEYLGSL